MTFYLFQPVYHQAWNACSHKYVSVLNHIILLEKGGGLCMSMFFDGSSFNKKCINKNQFQCHSTMLLAALNNPLKIS